MDDAARYKQAKERVEALRGAQDSGVYGSGCSASTASIAPHKHGRNEAREAGE